MKFGVMAAVVAIWAGCAQAQAPRDEGDVAAAVEVLVAAEALAILLPSSELAACQVAIDATRRNTGDVRASSSRIAMLHAGLVRGSSPLQIVRIRSPFVQRELDFLKAELDKLHPFLDVAARGEFEATYLAVMRDHRVRATEQADRVVSAISGTFMHSRVDLFESGTLRALSQLELSVEIARAAICAIRLGLEAPRAELGTAVTDFAQALDLATSGDTLARVLPPSPVLTEALNCASNRFKAERGTLADIARGATLDTLDAGRVEAGLAALLFDVRLVARIYKAQLADYPIPDVSCAAVI